MCPTFTKLLFSLHNADWNGNVLKKVLVLPSIELFQLTTAYAWNAFSISTVNFYFSHLLDLL